MESLVFCYNPFYCLDSVENIATVSASSIAVNRDDCRG